MNPKVSIIIPVYNASKFLCNCFDSCVNQTLQEIEIIAVNDCSPDPQDSDIMQEYAKLYPNKFRCIWHNANKRTGGARNTGLNMAQGEYFLCVDNDDYLDLDMCERMYAKAKQENADLVYCDIKIHRNNKMQKYSTMIDIEENLFEFKHEVWKTMAKRIFIKENKLYFPENVTVDDLIGYLWHLKANKISKIDNLYYNHIRHSLNESSDYNYNYLFGVPCVFFEFSKHKSFIELTEHKKKIMCFAMVRHSFLYVYAIYLHHINKFYEYCAECYKTFKVYENYFDRSLFRISKFKEFELLETLLFVKSNINSSDFIEKYTEFYNNMEQSFYSKNLLPILEQYKNHNLSLWGAGAIGIRYTKYLSNMNITFEVTDTNSKIHGKKLTENVVVKSWDSIKNHTNVVFVSAKGIFEDVRDKLAKECPNIKVVDLVDLLGS